jgi:hypothetical protein
MNGGFSAIRLALVGLICLVAGQAAGAAHPAAPYVVRDFLGRAWRNELVCFPVDEASLRCAWSGKAWVGSDGRALPYQILAAAPGSSARVAFLADVGPFEVRAYRFTDAVGRTRTDLKIERGPELLRIANAKTGLAIARRLTGGAGPVHAVRTASGAWVGSSRLVGGRPQNYRAEVVAEGPVFAEIACKASFGEGRAWSLRFRLQAGEPAIVVDETFS